MPLTNYAYVNGKFVREAEATVSIFDRGFLYGDGCFETMRVYEGKVFRMASHLTRLRDGVVYLGITPALTTEEIRVVCEMLIERNRVQSGVVRVYVTSGAGNFGPVSRADVGSSVVIVAKPRVFRDVKLRAIVAEQRLDVGLSMFKTANRLPYILARHEAEKKRMDEAILLNRQGNVVEFSASNLFVVKSDELWTPPLEDGPLPGVTRSTVLACAREMHMKVREKSFGKDFLLGADEIIATNSLIELAPVLQLHDQPLASWRYVALHTAYRQLVREELGL